MNFKQKKYVSKTGVEYTFQRIGARAMTKLSDRVKNRFGVPQEEKLADEMLQHVVVDPKVKQDDLDYAEMNEVCNAAYAFVTGADDDEEEGSKEKG